MENPVVEVANDQQHVTTLSLRSKIALLTALTDRGEGGQVARSTPLLPEHLPARHFLKIIGLERHTVLNVHGGCVWRVGV